MKVSLKNITKKFGATTAVKDANLEIRDGELFFILGPSGCGKTTILRMVAGFYQPDEGRLLFNERVMNVVPPNKRNTGMVFQNYALWPHLTVEENVGYGLEVRGVSTTERRKRVQEMLELVQMQDYASRTANQLSGGQQQRIALARALVIRPDILLLDEPLSNLDAKLRLDLRDEIRRLHREFRLTMLYVTHDQKEALSLADRMAIMDRGMVIQCGTPRDIYRSPMNSFVGSFIGEMNLIPGKVLSRGPDGWEVQTAVGILRSATATEEMTCHNIMCGIRPEGIQIASASGMFRAVVKSVSYLGEFQQYSLLLNDQVLWKATELNPRRLRKEGETVHINIQPEDVILLKE